MDGIPILSQVKSLVQYVVGQPEKALETQQNFSRQCPGYSQVRSAIEAVYLDDPEAALETQKQCGHFVGGLVDGIPVVGHIKGGIHYAVGDSEGGDSAMKAASHSTAVVAGGAVGMLGGPAGAVVGGIAAGAAMDAVITIADTEINGRVNGRVRTFGILEPLSDPTDAGKWVDAAGGVILDGVTGRGAGKIASKVAHHVKTKNTISKRAPAVVEKRINESSSGSAATNVVKSVRVHNTWPHRVTVSPNMTVFMMVRNECFYFFLGEVKEKAEVIILKDMLTDVGPMVVEFLGRCYNILFRNGTCHFRRDSDNEQELEKGKIYTLSPGGSTELIMADGKEKENSIGFWKNTERVALFRFLLKLVK